jgi:hypothetical protein
MRVVERFLNTLLIHQIRFDAAKLVWPPSRIRTPELSESVGHS